MTLVAALPQWLRAARTPSDLSTTWWGEQQWQRDESFTGFFAVITIQVDDVVIDLNRHGIAMAPASKLRCLR